LITIIFLLLAAVAMVGIIVNLVTHRGQAAVEEEYRR
jgi:hypothetical protein